MRSSSREFLIFKRLKVSEQSANSPVLVLQVIEVIGQLPEERGDAKGVVGKLDEEDRRCCVRKAA